MAKRTKRIKTDHGSIQYRGARQLRARIMIQGKSYTATFESEEAARSWLNALWSKSDNADNLARTLDAQKLTLKKAMEEYANHHANERGRDQTIKRVDALCEREPALVALRIHEVTEEHISALIVRRRAEGKAPATINNDLAFIAGGFKVARTHMGCAGLRNPGVEMRLKLRKQPVRRLRVKEEDALVRAAIQYEMQSTSAIPIHQIILFAIATAMRRGEIARLDWEHINLSRATAHLPLTKNEDARTVALSPPALALLRERGPKESGPVWGSYQQIGDAWSNVRAIAAVEHPRMISADPRERLKFHHLRHEAVSRLFEDTDLSDGEIATITGHRSIQSLWIYRHLRADRTAAKLASAWAKQQQEVAASGLSLVGGTDATGPAHFEDQLPVDLRKRSAWRMVGSDASILGALIQAKPIREIAADFGISDVAVHHACERLGITKQPRGHWLKKAV